jgi:hypothetical protein
MSYGSETLNDRFGYAMMKAAKPHGIRAAPVPITYSAVCRPPVTA